MISFFRKDLKEAGATIQIAPREIASRYRVSTRDLALNVAATESLQESLQRLRLDEPAAKFDE